MTAVFVTAPTSSQATRAFHARNLETGDEGIIVTEGPIRYRGTPLVLVPDPVMRFCIGCHRGISMLYSTVVCEHCGETNGRFER